MAEPPTKTGAATAAENGATEASADSQGTVEPQPEFVELAAGSALEASETFPITRAARTHLLVFAGGEASGKTTLLTSIYESLQEGPFAGMVFAGSRTLVGFEEICHLNRLASGQPVPETERTKPSDRAQFYHLSLLDRGAAKPVRREVLIAAVSGELFRLARDSTEDCSTLTFLRRADVIAVLIDGAKVIQLDARQGALADAEGILRSFLDAGMLSRNARVEFVFSKYDCVQKAGTAAESFVDRARARLLQPFADRVSSIGTRCIAARPTEARLPFAFGVNEALRSWLSDVASPSGALAVWVEAAEHEREFAKYDQRYRKSKERQA